jgi:hypothetical protein
VGLPANTHSLSIDRFEVSLCERVIRAFTGDGLMTDIACRADCFFGIGPTLFDPFARVFDGEAFFGDLDDFFCLFADAGGSSSSWSLINTALSSCVDSSGCVDNEEERDSYSPNRGPNINEAPRPIAMTTSLAMQVVQEKCHSHVRCKCTALKNFINESKMNYLTDARAF